MAVGTKRVKFADSKIETKKQRASPNTHPHQNLPQKGATPNSTEPVPKEAQNERMLETPVRYHLCDTNILRIFLMKWQKAAETAFNVRLLQRIVGAF